MRLTNSGDFAPFTASALSRAMMSFGVPAGAKPGQEVRLHTRHIVREDAQLLFGFTERDELRLFDLLIGVNALDYSGYPDCRPEYIAAYETMANLATRAGVEGTARTRILTPLIALSKADIIRTGLAIVPNGLGGSGPGAGPLAAERTAFVVGADRFGGDSRSGR